MELQHHQQQSSLSSQSPSFTSYSSSRNNLADIAARVVSELNLDSDNPYDDHQLFPDPKFQIHEDENEVEEDDDDDSEFEFAVLNNGEDTFSPISADEIFYNGQIKPIYPLFNTNLIYQNDALDQQETSKTTIRLSLRRLMKDEKESNGAVSCSSSESCDELEGVPNETYCVWKPKKDNDKNVSMKNKKSKSTGANSKRWRIRDLLHRSNSDGKDTFVFLTPTTANNHRQRQNNNQEKHHKNGGDYRKRNNNNNNKSYLPYRPDIVGFFSNVNGISRTVRPF